MHNLTDKDDPRRNAPVPVGLSSEIEERIEKAADIESLWILHVVLGESVFWQKSLKFQPISAIGGLLGKLVASLQKASKGVSTPKDYRTEDYMILDLIAICQCD